MSDVRRDPARRRQKRILEAEKFIRMVIDNGYVEHINNGHHFARKYLSYIVRLAKRGAK